MYCHLTGCYGSAGLLFLVQLATWVSLDSTTSLSPLIVLPNPVLPICQTALIITQWEQYIIYSVQKHPILRILICYWDILVQWFFQPSWWFYPLIQFLMWWLPTVKLSSVLLHNCILLLYHNANTCLPMVLGDPCERDTWPPLPKDSQPTDWEPLFYFFVGFYYLFLTFFVFEIVSYTVFWCCFFLFFKTFILPIMAWNLNSSYLNLCYIS